MCATWSGMLINSRLSVVFCVHDGAAGRPRVQGQARKEREPSPEAGILSVALKVRVQVQVRLWSTESIHRGFRLSRVGIRARCSHRRDDLHTAHIMVPCRGNRPRSEEYGHCKVRRRDRDGFLRQDNAHVHTPRRFHFLGLGILGFFRGIEESTLLSTWMMGYWLLYSAERDQSVTLAANRASRLAGVFHRSSCHRTTRQVVLFCYPFITTRSCHTYFYHLVFNLSHPPPLCCGRVVLGDACWCAKRRTGWKFPENFLEISASASQVSLQGPPLALPQVGTVVPPRSPRQGIDLLVCRHIHCLYYFGGCCLHSGGHILCL